MLLRAAILIAVGTAHAVDLVPECQLRLSPLVIRKLQPYLKNGLYVVTTERGNFEIDSVTSAVTLKSTA